MLFDVHWVQAGVTQVEANSHEEARQLLVDYPFCDDADRVDVVAVEPAEENP